VSCLGSLQLRCCVEGGASTIHLYTGPSLDWQRRQNSPMSGHPLDNRSLPSLLYRVQYTRTRTKYTRTGLRAASQDYVRFGAALREAIETHYDWAARVPSPLISTFTDDIHAARWAAGRPGPVTILTISRDELRRNDYVFEGPEDNDELFFLHKIPARAIVDEAPLREFGWYSPSLIVYSLSLRKVAADEVGVDYDSNSEDEDEEEDSDDDDDDDDDDDEDDDDGY